MSFRGPCEPIIPRRKKHPDLAYRTNEWFGNSTSSNKPLAQLTQPKKEKMTAIGESIEIKPKKSISMGTIPVHAPIYSHALSARAQQIQSNDVGGIDISEVSENQEFSAVRILPDLFEDKAQNESKQDGVTKRKEYKTEYKNKFRPFSQYEYVDGKFLKKDKDHDSSQSPWFAEVIELRKKAGEYKFRGWGTDLSSSNTTENYNQQLWEQVSRRSSLAPLALITTTPRYTPKEEKDKRNAKKRLPGKEGHPRPHTATPKHAISDLEGYKNSKDNEAVQPRKKKMENPSKKAISKAKARSQSAGPINRSSPQKTTTRQPSSASSASEKDGVNAGWKIPMEYDSKPKQRYIRPTTLATSPRSRASSGKGDLDANSKLANQHRNDKSSADPSLGYSDSSVVKSPVEPTRVKSPDQAGVKSPDGVKWTVPLDTTKGFIVTQNIREGVSDDVNSASLEASAPQSKLVKIAVNGSEERPARKLGPIFPNKSKALPPSAIKKFDESSKYPNTSSVDGKSKSTLDEAKKKPESTVRKVGAPQRCLEDPLFETVSLQSSDKNKSALRGPLKKIPEKEAPKIPVPKSAIRVLEAPVVANSSSKTNSADQIAQNSAVISSAKRAIETNPQETQQVKIPTYRVLEAPEKPVEKTASGSKTSDVLKKARHRFDKFWSKSKDEE